MPITEVFDFCNLLRAKTSIFPVPPCWSQAQNSPNFALENAVAPKY